MLVHAVVVRSYGMYICSLSVWCPISIVDEHLGLWKTWNVWQSRHAFMSQRRQNAALRTVTCSRNASAIMSGP